MSSIPITHPQTDTTDSTDRLRVRSPEPHLPRFQRAGARLLLGLCSVVPLGGLVAILAYGPERPLSIAMGFGVLLWTALMIAMFGGYAFRNPRLAPQTRRAWLFLMVIGAPLTLPVYWAKHVWSPPYRRTGRPRRVVETG